MNENQRALFLLSLIFCIAFVASRAHADDSSTVANPSAAPTSTVLDAAVADGHAGKYEIRSAVAQLDQAALQWDFSSHAQELHLLQSARARLASSIAKLCSPQRQRAQLLESDLDDVILRAGVRIEPLRSATGASYGPPAPTRGQLAQLATEAQDVELDAPTMHRLMNSVHDASIRSSQEARVQSPGDSFDSARGDALSWPMGTPSATSQFAFDFDVGRASH